MIVRHAQEDDYQQLSEVYNLVYPEDLLSTKEFKHIDESYLEPCKFARFVAEENKQILGSCNFEQHQGMYHPQKFVIYVWVHPEHEAKGIGAKLYQTLISELNAFNPISLRVQVRENSPRALEFAKVRGFQEDKRDWQSVLDLSKYEKGRFKDLKEKVLQAGITIKSLADFEDKDAIQRAFFDCFTQVRQDVPRSEPATPLSWEYMKKSMFDAPDFYPEGTFVAFQNDEMIGLSQLWKGESSNDLYTGLTAVKRKARAKGIATALKVHALEFAKETKAHKIYTENDTKNTEMIAINAKLGFEKQPAWLSMKKEMKQA